MGQNLLSHHFCSQSKFCISQLFGILDISPMATTVVIPLLLVSPKKSSAFL